VREEVFWFCLDCLPQQPVDGFDSTLIPKKSERGCPYFLAAESVQDHWASAQWQAKAYRRVIAGLGHQDLLEKIPTKKFTRPFSARQHI